MECNSHVLDEGKTKNGLWIQTIGNEDHEKKITKKERILEDFEKIGGLLNLEKKIICDKKVQFKESLIKALGFSIKVLNTLQQSQV